MSAPFLNSGSPQGFAWVSRACSVVWKPSQGSELSSHRTIIVYFLSSIDHQSSLSDVQCFQSAHFNLLVLKTYFDLYLWLFCLTIYFSSSGILIFLEAINRHSWNVPFLSIHLLFLSLFQNSMSLVIIIPVLTPLVVCSALFPLFGVASSCSHHFPWALSACDLSPSVVTSYLPLLCPYTSDVFSSCGYDCFII